MELMGIKRNSKSRKLNKKSDYFKLSPIVPGIWGDRVAGLAHHLLAHIGDHCTPIQLLKTPNSEHKKYIFPATQLGKLPNTSRTEQERTHTSPARGASQLSLCLYRRPSPTSAVIGRCDVSQALHWSRCWWFHPLGRMNLITGLSF